MDSNVVGYILGGPKRKAVFLALDKPRTPSEISKIAHVSESNVWKKLDDLSKVGVVKCTTPQLRKGRLYDRTFSGKDAFESIKDRMEPLRRKR